MAANTLPRFKKVGVVGTGIVSVANSSLDGTGTVVTILTAGTNGSIVELIRVKALGATSAGMIRIFLHVGSTFSLYAEIEVTVVSPSGTVKSFSAEYLPTTVLVLPPGMTLRASTENGESFKILVIGGDL